MVWDIIQVLIPFFFIFAIVNYVQHYIYISWSIKITNNLINGLNNAESYLYSQIFAYLRKRYAICPGLCRLIP